jgi:predicted Zn-dependent peptidase
VNTLEAQFRKVTPALIQKTAREYLRSSNRTIRVVEPKTAPADAEKPAKSGE